MIKRIKGIEPHKKLSGSLKSFQPIWRRHYSDSNDYGKLDHEKRPHVDFTNEEYEKAAEYIKNQIKKVESDIKGDHNIRENMEKFQVVPSLPNRKRQIRVNNLTNLLAETIKFIGPISLLAYMRQCLTHPQFGYYTTRDPLSRTGDFITSPEISSTFGEMIGIWLFGTWLNQSKPSRLNIIEFGPGKGTLMYDCFKTFNRLKKDMISSKDIEITLVEASAILRKEQHKMLCGTKNTLQTTEEGFNESCSIWGNKIRWVYSEKDLVNDENITNYIICHEFFDALPIKSFLKKDNVWKELVVDHAPSIEKKNLALSPGEGDSTNTSFDPEFYLTISPKETKLFSIPGLKERFMNLPEGTRIEVCPDAELYVLSMVRLLDNKKQRGSILVVDYGISEGIPNNTLRGIYKHKFVSPFIRPGEVDLSVDVDFQNLKLVTNNFCQSYGPVEQGDFLHELGIGYRTKQLLESTRNDMEAQERIYEAYLRLTSKGENYMGKAYKVLCFMPFNNPAPLGFGGSVEAYK